MSSNTLVAFCVACLFLLALVAVALSFIERRPRAPKEPLLEQPTERWPEQKNP